VLSGYKVEHHTDSDFHLLPLRLKGKKQKQPSDMKGEKINHGFCTEIIIQRVSA